MTLIKTDKKIFRIDADGIKLANRLQLKAVAKGGQDDFYLNLLNEKERAPDDNPSIGIILCAE